MRIIKIKAMFILSSQVRSKKLGSWPGHDLPAWQILRLIATTGDCTFKQLQGDSDWCASLFIYFFREIRKTILRFWGLRGDWRRKIFSAWGSIFSQFFGNSGDLRPRWLIELAARILVIWRCWKFEILYSRFGGAFFAAFSLFWLFQKVDCFSTQSPWKNRMSWLCSFLSKMKKSKWLKSAQVISVADSKTTQGGFNLLNNFLFFWKISKVAKSSKTAAGGEFAVFEWARLWRLRQIWQWTRSWIQCPNHQLFRQFCF